MLNTFFKPLPSPAGSSRIIYPGLSSTACSAMYRARQTRTVIRKSAVLVCLFYLKAEIMIIKNRAGK
ncbi:hypothetical protein AM380_06810 [Morganella morganii]|uniref:Uncharacterized protein n=1 Tax=Morganella morganii TaxID=582 RepID=A0AAU8ZKQ1_MORMO|nr:hypothetical protein AM380_06810 [Morganella morganii]